VNGAKTTDTGHRAEVLILGHR